jgi:hypothetical protein
MYADDNADKVVNNFGATETQAEINGQTYRNWANNVLDWTSNQVNTNTGLLKVGIMSSYAGPAAAIYRCPADDYVSPSQHALGWNSRARSISMNGFFGAFDANTNGVWATGRNPIVSNYRQWLKIAQVNSPGRFFVTIDEHPDSINEGYFINNISGSPPSNWGDLPASLHNAGSTITFVDGRAEIHKWQSGTTRTPIRFFYNPSVFDSLGRADFQWLKDRSAVLY